MKTITSLVLLLTLAAPAAEKGDWTRVQSLRPGTRIGIVTTQSQLEGEFATATGMGITLETAGRAQTIAKETVVRVYRRPSLTRKKRMLIGMAAGAAVGGGIAAGVGGGSNGEGFFNGKSGGAAVGLAIGGGAAIGAVIGAATGGGVKTIYQR